VTRVPIFGGALNEDLPAVVGLLPTQDKKGERTGLQLVLVKRQVVNDHRLLIGAGELKRGMRGARRKRARVHIRPEGLRQRPEAHGESLLGRPLDVDELPAGVPRRVVVSAGYHRVGGVRAGAASAQRRLQIHFRSEVQGRQAHRPLQQEGVVLGGQGHKRRVTARLLKVYHNAGLQLLD